MATGVVAAVDRVEVLERGFADYVNGNRRSGSSPHSYVYASARRHCLRRMVLEATQPEVFTIRGVDVKARLWRGEQRERDIVIDLKRVGQLTAPRFEVIAEQEHVRIRNREDRVIISGRIDGRIAWEDGISWPIEVKSWSPFLTDRIDTFADLYENRWTWSGAHQLLSYLYAKPEPTGLLVLDKPGLPKLVPVSLEENLEQTEAFLRDAEAVVEHIKAGTLPDFTTDAEECTRCPAYGAVCNPPIGAEGCRVLADPELEAMLARRAELYDAAKEFDRLDTKVKKQLRGVEQGICGPFHIQGEWGRQSRLELPETLKKQYTRVDYQGRFTLTITKLGDVAPTTEVTDAR